MTLTVRSASVTGATTATRALTHAEMDANWAHVIDSSNQTFTPSGSGAVVRTVQDRLRDSIHAFDFIPTSLHNAISAATSTEDLTGYLQAGIDAVHALSPGGTIYVPRGLYTTDQLTLKYKVSILGPAPARSVFGSAIFHLKNGANRPLIVNDQVNGPSQGTGIDGGTQRSQISAIQNIALRGNSANQTSIDADILRLTNAWYLDLIGCLLVSAKGFGIRALDCNVLHIRDCHGFNAPIFMESVADSIFKGNQWGGGDGLPYSVLQMSETNCWKNNISNNFIYNNSNNLGVTQPTFTSDSGGTSHILTTNAAHGWTDETPVIVSTTSALPAGLSANTVYYVKVLSTTTVRLATSRANLAAGTFVNVSGAGTGTHTIGIGRNAGLYLSTGVKWNAIHGNRFDQHYGAGILLGGATENTLSGNTVTENGLANATAQSGIKLESATKNTITSNLIDGTVIAIGASNTNQTIGIEGDSGSTANVITGNKSVDHSTANIQMASGYTTSELTDELFIPYTMFTPAGGTSPAVGDYASARRNALMFAAAGSEIAETMVLIPKGWESATPTVVWINDGAGSGDVVWRVQCLARVAGETMNSADDTGDSGGDPFTAGAQDVVVVSALGTNLTALDQGDYASLRVTRLGDEVADTLANDAGLLGVKLVRA